MISAPSDVQPVCFLNEDVLFVDAPDGSSRLLHLGGRFFALSRSGTALLRTALRTDWESAIGDLAERFDIDQTLIANDLEGLVESLESNDLVRRERKAESWRIGEWFATKTIPVLMRLCFGSPSLLLALSWFSLRVFGWRATVEAWRRWPADESASVESASSISERVTTAASNHLLPVACAERGLTCWHLLKRGGFTAGMVIGVDFYPFAAHCWCVCDGEVLSDYSDRCTRYIPVLTYE